MAYLGEGAGGQQASMSGLSVQPEAISRWLTLSPSPPQQPLTLQLGGTAKGLLDDKKFTKQPEL